MKSTMRKGSKECNLVTTCDLGYLDLFHLSIKALLYLTHYSFIMSLKLVKAILLLFLQQTLAGKIQLGESCFEEG